MTAIELSDEQAEQLKAQAEARGLTVGEWIAQLTGHIAPKPELPVDGRPVWDILATSLKDISPEDRALIPKDGGSQVDHYVYGLPKRDK